MEKVASYCDDCSEWWMSVCGFKRIHFHTFCRNKYDSLSDKNGFFHWLQILLFEVAKDCPIVAHIAVVILWQQT